MADNLKNEDESSLSSYFQETSSSIFDQISPENLNVSVNTTQTFSQDIISETTNVSNTSNIPVKDSNSLYNLKLGINDVNSSNNGGYRNPAFLIDNPAEINPMNQLASPGPAVLTPGVNPQNFQVSTPFKEIDSSQVAMFSSEKESKFPLPQIPKVNNELSPNTSVNIESTIAKFSLASISDVTTDASLPITAHQAPITYSPIPPRSLPTHILADNSNDKMIKTSKYFTSNKSAFEVSRNLNQSNTSLSDSAMMNPVYMSPTDNFNMSSAIPSPDSFLTPATEQDVFTASLLSSDADRRHDAWIPSESTKKALLAMSSSPPGTYFPEKDLLTMPGIAVKEDFGDPVKNLVRTYLGEDAASKRQVLTASSVTQDDRGVRQLMSSGCYHAAVNLTTQLLTVYGQGEGRAGHLSKHTAHSIQLWFTRLALLVKLRRFSLAEVECQFFRELDAPDLYFQFYPELYGGRKGSMVPFSFRLLVAELPQYLGKHTQGLDRLNSLLRTCDKIVSNLVSGLSEDGSQVEMSSGMRDDSLKLWRTRRIRVLYAITSCATAIKDFRLAGGLIQKLLQEDLMSTAGLYSALGRLCLQLGNLKAAEEAFKRYLEHSPPPPLHDPIQGLLHSAYIACAQNDFKYAVQILQHAYKINPNNGLVMSNLGACLMYTGDVREAIGVVEGAIIAHPDRFLHEAVVLNLATMYELESSNAHENKLKLLSLVAQHKGDSFNVAALKLQQQ